MDIILLFNSHPHKEDDGRRTLCAVERDFSTHILTRRMTCTPSLCSSGTIFSTHILTRRMTRMQNPHTEIQLFFNSHPHKEDDVPVPSPYIQYYIFNSHPHKEDDLYLSEHSARILFSTHILTRRMTVKLCDKNNIITFSTHILTRRMTMMEP